jgi:hypothetical protein
MSDIKPKYWIKILSLSVLFLVQKCCKNLGFYLSEQQLWLFKANFVNSYIKELIWIVELCIPH